MRYLCCGTIHRGGVNLESLELARHIVDVIAEKKGENILLLDISSITVVADYFVIVTATSDRQKRALVSEVSRTTKEDLNVRPLHIEGGTETAWNLLDYGSVVVHIFTHEAREYYDLEGLWHDGKVVVNVL
jgi:ribosome-associated protein